MPFIVTCTFEGEVRFRIPVPYSVRISGVSTPRATGVATHPEGSHRNTGTGDCNAGFEACTLIAVAAATPFPSPLKLKSVGATVSTMAVAAGGTALPFITVNVAAPFAVPAGTTKLI